MDAVKCTKETHARFILFERSFCAHYLEDFQVMDSRDPSKVELPKSLYMYANWAWGFYFEDVVTVIAVVNGQEYKFIPRGRVINKSPNHYFGEKLYTESELEKMNVAGLGCYPGDASFVKTSNNIFMRFKLGEDILVKTAV